MDELLSARVVIPTRHLSHSGEPINDESRRNCSDNNPHLKSSLKPDSLPSEVTLLLVVYRAKRREGSAKWRILANNWPRPLHDPVKDYTFLFAVVGGTHYIRSSSAFTAASASGVSTSVSAAVPVSGTSATASL